MPQQRGDRLRFRNLTGAQRWLLAAIIVVSAALRIGSNNVETYSPADETVYANYTRCDQNKEDAMRIKWTTLYVDDQEKALQFYTTWGTAV